MRYLSRRNDKWQPPPGQVLVHNWVDPPTDGTATGSARTGSEHGRNASTNRRR